MISQGDLSRLCLQPKGNIGLMLGHSLFLVSMLREKTDMVWHPGRDSEGAIEMFVSLEEQWGRENPGGSWGGAFDH